MIRRIRPFPTLVPVSSPELALYSAHAVGRGPLFPLRTVTVA